MAGPSAEAAAAVGAGAGVRTDGLIHDADPATPGGRTSPGPAESSASGARAHSPTPTVTAPSQGPEVAAGTTPTVAAGIAPPAFSLQSAWEGAAAGAPRTKENCSSRAAST